ncbi:hypothetical protein [Paenibacillus macerans]|uniref:hypothetical protein n=1 Tax=Paenibacillus macerans TaxID=44252 RepID=UPI003D30F4E9
MKITDWAVIFVLIVSPLLWIGSLQAEDVREVNRLETRYTAALRTATQDAGNVLNRNELQQFESGYGSEKWMRADKEQALAALLNSLYLNFGVADDPVGQQALMVYIPAIVVIDYNGYFIYSVEETASPGGSTEARHRWRSKKPFVYADSFGNSLGFTLDRYITAYDVASDRWVSGLQNEIKSQVSIPLLQDHEQFEAVRRSVIVRSIEEELAEVINRHNAYAAKQGVSYTFTLPFIPQEDWNNTLDDVGILVFLQGLPVGVRYYNNYALGGGRVAKSSPVWGALNPANGLKYYYNDGCLPAQSQGKRIEEVFADERAAAANGYFPADCRRSAKK